MSESPVEALEKALGPSLIWTGVLNHSDTLRGTRSSMLQKVMMADTFLKLLGIPISLWQIER